MSALLEQLRGGLIASCQPVDDGPMDRPDTVAAMAQAAVAGGAVGVRIEGVKNLRAARAAVKVPIIGIVKSDSPDTPVRITVSTDDVAGLIEAGADIVAFDATDRPRHHDREDILRAILNAKALAMADCSTLADGKRALLQGAAILGTTLSGYTAETERADTAPDLNLIRTFRQLNAFVMAEGRFDTPDLTAAAIRAGADAVTVGSVLTRLEVVTGRFADAIRTASGENQLTGFAVDLGGTKTAAARFEAGQVVNKTQSPTNGNTDPDTLVALMRGQLRNLGYRSGDLLGVAVTGRVDQQGNWYAVNRNTLSKIGAFPLAQRVREVIGPASAINDAAAATLAEHRLGAGRGHQNFAYVTVSTGVGGGLILNDRLHQSPNGLAGHVGFTSGAGGQRQCGSGRIGTVESAASGWAIAAAAKALGHEEMDARAIFSQADVGAQWAENLIDASAHAISELSGDIAAMLGATRIALGGSIGLADGYLDRAREHQAGLPELFRADLVAAKLGVLGPLLGALLIANDFN
jgi:N-acetylmannosamine-6-phosphate 2-epimerase / N-acetylmannosamine kinase